MQGLGSILTHPKLTTWSPRAPQFCCSCTGFHVSLGKGSPGRVLVQEEWFLNMAPMSGCHAKKDGRICCGCI